MSKRNTRKAKKERARKTIGKQVRIHRQTLFFEFCSEDGTLEKVAVDCPPELASTRIMLSCTPGVRWYMGERPLIPSAN